MIRKELLGLTQWLIQANRKPLVPRGVRQSGKTWLVRELAKSQNQQLIEINFENRPELRSLFIFPLLLSIWMFTASYSSQVLGETMTFKLQSSAFNDGSSIPSKYTCDGNDISPPLSWEGEPQNTKSFVLIVDDPDAPNGVWNHWILFNIPKTTHELSENLTSLPNGIQSGKNSWGKSTYGGPCPPTGEHRYYFKIYALDTLLTFSADASKSQIEAAMQDHVIDNAKLLGRYKK